MQRCKAQAKGDSEKAQADLEAMEKRLNETRRSSEATKRRLEAEEKSLKEALSEKVGVANDLRTYNVIFCIQGSHKKPLTYFFGSKSGKST